ncbi:MAG TPA: type II secretion system F family protein, partial [Sphingomicrobium sp.]|nr:type II secretion system F family protein [Sphingomicrobium sp.]
MNGTPTLLGVDVIWVATVLSAVATLAVLTAIYAATTVRDPMARRVKALNDRREQLKAGIVASTNKRKKLTNKNQAADRVRGILSSFRMLQDDQIKKTQVRLMQAGIRTKELAFFIIFARFVMPVVLGVGAILLIYVIDYFPHWSGFKKYMFVAGTLVLSYKAPDLWLSNKVKKRSHAIRKGLPDALDLLVICAEAGLTVDAAFNRVAKELGKAYPELGDEFGLTAIELGFLSERRQAF